MNRAPILLAIVCLSLEASPAPAATVLFCPFESLAGWSVRSAGATDARIVRESDSMEFVELASRRGTVFLSRELPLEDVAGCRVSVSCLVKSEGIVAGHPFSSDERRRA